MPLQLFPHIITCAVLLCCVSCISTENKDEPSVQHAQKEKLKTLELKLNEVRQKIYSSLPPYPNPADYPDKESFTEAERLFAEILRNQQILFLHKTDSITRDALNYRPN